MKIFDCGMPNIINGNKLTKCISADLTHGRRKNSVLTVATLGMEYLQNERIDDIKRLVEYGINYFRINLSKFEDEKSINGLTNKILKLKKYYPSIQIMIDLPLPHKKTRFTLMDGSAYIDVKKGEALNLSYSVRAYNKRALCLIGTEETGKNRFSIGERIIYADGECEFLVSSINKENVQLTVQNDCRLFSKKSLSFTSSLIDSKSDKDMYRELLQEVEPCSVAFSFVSSQKDVLEMKKYVDGLGIKTEIVSKIENIDAVNRMPEILEVSDIMLARGDLSINVAIEDFFKVQEVVLNSIIRSNRKVYVATGFLNSLSYENMPTQAEITDLSYVLSYSPYAIILNFGVVRSDNMSKAIAIVDRISNSLNTRALSSDR